MFDHLINFEPPVEAHPGATPVEKLSPAEHAQARIETSDWLKTLGDKPAEEVIAPLEQQAARQAFVAMTTTTPAPDAHALLNKLDTPPAVRHLVGMLTAYDWEFVQQAQQLRGYAVAKILEECEHPTASIRLKALGMLGKITEVGLFTDKVEVKKTDLTEAEIDAKLKEKLAKFMDVSDAEIIDVEEKHTTPAEIHTTPAETHTTSDANDIDPENPDAS